MLEPEGTIAYVLTVRADGTVRRINPVPYGYRAEEIEGTRLLDLVSASDRASVHAAVSDALDRERPSHCRVVLTPTTETYDMRLEPVSNAGGVAGPGLIVTARQVTVTEARSTIDLNAVGDFWEAYVSQREQLLQAFAAAARERKALRDMKERFSAQELRGLCEVAEERVARCLIDRDISLFESAMRARGWSCAQRGTPLWAWFTAGSVLAYVSMPRITDHFANDTRRALHAYRGLEQLCSRALANIAAAYLDWEKEVTARQLGQAARSEAEAAYAQDFLASVVQTSSDAIITTRLDGTVVSWNSASELLFGYRAGEAVGRHLTLIVPPDRILETDQLLERLRAGQASPAHDTVHITKDGRRVETQVSAAAVRVRGSHEHSGASFIVRDMTDRRRMERELERSNDELAQFASTAAHDLQEPLRKVKRVAAQLEQDLAHLELSESTREDLEVLTQATRRMASAIRSQLEFALVRDHAFERQRVSIKACVREVQERLAEAIEVNGALISEDPLPEVDADTELVIRIYQNLLSNALKYSGDSSPHIHFSADRIEGCWVLGVKDDGIGIDPKYLEAVFAPLKRLHPRHRYGGDGLGLALCRRAVERHGGHIWAESEGKGHGSHFKFTLASEKVPSKP